MFKKVILPGLIAGLIILIVSMATSKVFTFIFPELQMEYENNRVFRSWSDPLMLLYFFHPFFLGLILSYLWDKTKIVFSYENQWKNVIQFALAYWLISLSGMVISYSTFQISFVMVASWTIGVLVQSFLSGLIFSRMNPYD